MGQCEGKVALTAGRPEAKAARVPRGRAGEGVDDLVRTAYTAAGG